MLLLFSMVVELVKILITILVRRFRTFVTETHVFAQVNLCSLQANIEGKKFNSGHVFESATFAFIKYFH